MAQAITSATSGANAAVNADAAAPGDLKRLVIEDVIVTFSGTPVGNPVITIESPVGTVRDRYVTESGRNVRITPMVECPDNAVGRVAVAAAGAGITTTVIARHRTYSN